jgi:ABC-2 type transport system ATP-binding protein
MYGVPKTERASRMDGLLQDFGLERHRSSRVETFSKGMKQKLALGRTLMHAPKVIFLDEPTMGLDPESAKMVREKISEMSQEERTTISLCTHNLAEAESLCSRVAIIKAGKIVTTGSPSQLSTDGVDSATYQVNLVSVPDRLLAVVKSLSFVETAVEEDSTINVQIKNPEENAPALAEAIIKGGGRIREFRKETRTLEDICLEAVRK